MLTSFYLVLDKIVEVNFYKFSPVDFIMSVMFCASIYTKFCGIATIFIAKHSMANLNNKYKLEEIQKIFILTRACIERKANAFQLYCVVLNI